MSGDGKQRFSRWVAGYWEDLKESTDSSLLTLARFFGGLYGPIERHSRIDHALKKALRYRLAPHVGWGHALGGITYLFFLVLIVTGVLLAFFYRPSAQEAYASIQNILTSVNFGWLMRDLHHWSANLIILAILAHMARVFFAAAYHPPRETSWLVGLVLMFVVLAFGATGYLLPWDQSAYWTVTEVLDALSGFPLIGGVIAGGLKGDEIPSGATLSRFFSWHVILLPWIALVLLTLHFSINRRHGVAPPIEPDPVERPGIPFFPHHVLRMIITASVVLGVLFSLALLFPRPVGPVANPYAVPDEITSTWVPVDVSLALLRTFGGWGLALFTLLGLSLALLPLFDRGPERRIRHRPAAAILGILFFVGFAGAWLAGRQLRTISPSLTIERQALEERLPPSIDETADTAAVTAPDSLDDEGRP